MGQSRGEAFLDSVTILFLSAFVTLVSLVAIILGCSFIKAWVMIANMDALTDGQWAIACLMPISGLAIIIAGCRAIWLGMAQISSICSDCCKNEDPRPNNIRARHLYAVLDAALD